MSEKNCITIKTVEGKTAGKYYSKSGLFVCPILTKHMLKTPPAIAKDVSILQDVLRRGGKEIIFHNRETGVTYRATLRLFFDKSFELDRGFGRQLALPLEYFTTEGGKGKPKPSSKMQPTTSPLEPKGPRQLTLWGRQ